MNVHLGQYEFSVQNDMSFWEHVDTWEPHSFRILDKFLDNKKLFIDVGSWNGVLSLYASKICKYVFAFEPDAKAYANLLWNVQRNGIKNVECVQKGAGKEDGVVKFYMRNPGDSVSSIIDRKDEKYKTSEVCEIQTLKLSSFLERKIDPSQIGLIKIDTEGGEILIVDEMEEFMKKYRPPMYVSFHPNWFPDKDYHIQRFAKVFNKYYTILDVNLERCNKEQFINGLYSTKHNYVMI